MTSEYQKASILLCNNAVNQDSFISSGHVQRGTRDPSYIMENGKSRCKVRMENRYVGSRHTSEWFNTIGRNVKTGHIASVIVPKTDLGGYNLAKLQCSLGV